jgi:hypothetical protein
MLESKVKEYKLIGEQQMGFTAEQRRKIAEVEKALDPPEEFHALGSVWSWGIYGQPTFTREHNPFLVKRKDRWNNSQTNRKLNQLKKP